MIAVPVTRRLPVFHPVGFSIEVARDDVSTAIAICGSFERQHIAAVETALKAAVCADGGIVVDLRRCQQIDSGAMMLLIAYKRALQDHVQIVVAQSGSVRRVLEISGIARKLAITPELEMARALLLAAC